MSSSRFIFSSTPLSGLKVFDRKIHTDTRGFFSRFFCIDEFREAGIDLSVFQINQTLTRKTGSVRGMHFQYPPHAEVKVVYCIKGEIFDVAIDLRNNSPTFLHWHSEILSAENFRGIIIPDGFAHGFQTLMDDCELIYLHSTRYCQDAEGGVNATDPKLAIQWPLPICDLSERDRSHPFISEDFMGISL